MTQTEYKNIILYGYVDNKKHLDGYFYRECKNAEVKHIAPIEFFERLIDEVIKFEDEIKRNHFSQLNDHYLLEGLWKSEGKDVKLLENQKPILEDFSINLHHYTNDHFRGHLSYNEVAFIKHSISKAMDKIKEEITRTIGPIKISNDIKSLTPEILKEYGFNESHISEILNADVYEQTCINNTGEYFISKSEMQIYSGNERFIKTGKPLMFPSYNINLIPDFYKQKLEIYLQQERNDLGITYIELKAIERFKQSEISSFTDAIKHNEKFASLTAKNRITKQYRGYINWLNKNETAINQSPAIDLIFNNKTNAFEVFKDLLEDLEITIGGKPQIKVGRVGKLTGLITAIKETPHMLKIEKPTDKQLLGYLNDYLKTSYKTFSKRNDDYLPSVDDAKRYIKNHFKK